MKYQPQSLFLFIMLLCFPVQAVCAQQQTNKAKNEELVLLFKVFTYANDLKRAENTASKALKLNPHSLYWHQKMSEVNQWRGNTKGTADNLAFIGANSHDQKASNKALKIYLASYQYEQAAKVALTILNENLSPENVALFISTYEKAGKTTRAADHLFLLYKKGKIKNPKLLTLLLEIYLQAGDLKSSKKIVSIINKKKITDFNARILVAKYYLIKNKIKKSYKSLLSVTSFSHVTPQEIINYKMLLSDVAWSEQAFKNSIHASKYIIKNDQGREVDFERVSQFYQYKHNNKQLLYYAKKKFETLQKDYQFYSYAYLALEQKQYQDLLAMITTIEDQKNTSINSLGFQQNSIFWMLKAELFSALKRPEDALNAFHQASLLNKNSPLQMVTKLWFLIDFNNGKMLKKHLALLEEQLEKGYDKSPELWMAMAVAYAMIQNVDRSNYYLQKVLSNPQNVAGKEALQILILKKMEKHGQAYKIEHARFVRMQKELTSDKSKQSNPEFLVTYLPLVMRYENPDTAMLQLKSAKKHLNKQEYTNLLIAFSLQHDDLDTTRYYSQYPENATPANDFKQETWLAFYFSLAEQDQTKQQDQLYSQFTTLSAVDRIRSAAELKKIPFAQALAFSGLATNKNSITHYKQHQQLTMNFADNISNEIYYIDRSGLGQSVNYFKSDFYVARGFSMTSELFTASNQVIDDTQLATVPDRTIKAGVGFNKLLTDGDIKVRLGLRKSMRSTAYIKGAWQHKINNRLNMTTSLAYGDDATESIYLSLGGQKDYLNLQANYTLTGSSQLAIQIEGSNYRSQDNKNLGTGASLLLQGIKTLKWRYPDIALSPYLSAGHYYENDADHGVINDLLLYSNTMVISQDYWHAGITLEVGTKTKNQYTHVWRPFFIFTPYYNSTASAMNYAFSLGGGGMLFGEDRLTIMIEHSESMGNTSDQTKKISLQYMKYF